MSRITQSGIANNALLLNTIKVTNAETTYAASTYTDVPGMTLSVTTTKANQVVMVTSQCQSFQGGYTNFQYVLDGTATGNPSQYNTGVNSTTTGATVFTDWFTIATAGSHVIKLQVSSNTTTLRIINGEGQGRMMVISG